jgi:cytochrome c-type biogenesis protein CcmE
MGRRSKFVIGIAAIAVAVGLLVFTAVDQTKMYMVTVAEYLGARSAYSGTTLRIAGRVQEGSIEWTEATRQLRFTLDDITDEGSVDVEYTGLLPDMFSEGRDVIVEGPHTDEEVFRATTVLTSCPSKYEAEQQAAAE